MHSVDQLRKTMEFYDACIGIFGPLYSDSPLIRIGITLSQVSSCVWLDSVFVSQ